MAIVAVAPLVCVAIEAPTGLEAIPGEGVVRLDWDDHTDGDLAGYNIYRSTNSGSFLGSIAGAGNSDYADRDVENGTTYYYVVTAVDTNDNESARSSEVSATPTDLPPAAPTGLDASVHDGWVVLEWDDNTEDDWSSYSVYRSTTSSSYGPALVSNLVLSIYGYQVVSNSTTYYYVVTASDDSGNESEKSTEVSVEMPIALNGYELWASTNGVGAATNDFDSDGLNNLYEYGLAGNPTNALDRGALPMFSRFGNGFIYVHPKRSNDTNITYTVETRTNLTSGSWTNDGCTVTGTNVTGGTLDFVTNDIDTVQNAKFIRLKIEQ